MNLKGIIFDLDGTIVDVPYDWSRIKADLGVEGTPILTYLSLLKDPEKSEKWAILRKYEDEATQKARLKKGMRGLLSFLSRTGVRKALVSNNSRENVAFLLRKFDLKFDWVISREAGLWKPSGAPFLEVLARLKLRKEEVAVVGDSHFDVNAAKEAGIGTVFLLGKDSKKFVGTGADVFPSARALQKRIKLLLAKGKGGT